MPVGRWEGTSQGPCLVALDLAEFAHGAHSLSLFPDKDEDRQGQVSRFALVFSDREEMRCTRHTYSRGGCLVLEFTLQNAPWGGAGMRSWHCWNSTVPSTPLRAVTQGLCSALGTDTACEPGAGGGRKSCNDAGGQALVF